MSIQKRRGLLDTTAGDASPWSILARFNGRRKTITFDACFLTEVQPHKWTDEMGDDVKWRSDFSDLFVHELGTTTEKYIKGWADIVFSDLQETGLPLSICDKVIIDEHPNNSNFFDQVSSIFQNCKVSHGLNLTIERRHCVSPKCQCKLWKNIENKNIEYKYSSGNWTTTYGKIA